MPCLPAASPQACSAGDDRRGTGDRRCPHTGLRPGGGAGPSAPISSLTAGRVAPRRGTRPALDAMAAAAPCAGNRQQRLGRTAPCYHPGSPPGALAKRARSSWPAPAGRSASPGRLTHFAAAFPYQGRRCLLCTTGRKALLRCRWRRACGVRGAGLAAAWWRGHGAEPYGGRCIMSRSGVFYVVKAMERTVAGTAAADAPPLPARPAADRGAAAAARPDGRTSSLVRRLLTAVQHRIGRAPGAVGRGRRRVGGAARAD